MRWYEQQYEMEMIYNAYKVEHIDDPYLLAQLPTPPQL